MHVLSVGDLVGALKELIEFNDGLRDLWVAGEIAEFKRYQSGHCYFTLKDERSGMRAVMWRTYAERQTTLPRNGDAVLAHGRVAIYEARGELQLVVDTIAPAGIGLMNARLEELRRRLEAEGLFDESRKRAIPALPRRIGIVTSLQAAALQDMLNVLRRRNPLVEVLIAPCLVQGERAPDSIVAALYQMYAADVDLIILARGGGSADDLWSFNDEAVARAVFASPVPLITGVGHETDTTLVDDVADLRAPTPSAAAELAAPERATLAAYVADLAARAADALQNRLQIRRMALSEFNRRLQRLSPRDRLETDRRRIDEISRRMNLAVSRRQNLNRNTLTALTARLATLSPQATLARGYAVVRDSAGHVLTNPNQVGTDDRLQITLRDGDLFAAVRPNEDAE